MHGMLENDFTINGIKNWVHCINIRTATPNNHAISYHYHNYIEFLYALSSDAYIWINGQCHPFQTGDLAIINSEELHTVTTNRESNYICVKFSPQILYSEQQALLEFKYVVPFLLGNSHQIIFHQEEISHINIPALVLEIMQEWERQKPAYELAIRANILKIFTGIFRYWRESNTLVDNVQLTDTIANAITYISKNFSTVTEKEVASVCGLSYHYFSHMFKKMLGRNFNEYLIAIKLREAEKLLISSDKSITEIAQEVGFSTASHFISHFKKQREITPKQFRKTIKPDI